MSRFVILFHRLPRPVPTAKTAGLSSIIQGEDHWDWMFEDQGKLLTWSTTWEPHRQATGNANRLADHRIDYLDYEGEISGERGRVERVYGGTFKLGSSGNKIFSAELFGEFQCSLKIVGPADGCQAKQLWELRTFSPQK